MKAVILAGGYGTRLAEETKLKPKPLVKIGKKPIIWHLIKIYSFYGIKEFIICLGYKGSLLKKELNKLNSKKKWNLKYVNTGLKTMTGGRVKRIKKFVSKEDNFCLSYGDGLSDVNIKNLIKFHKKNKKIATLTAVRPPARFGSIKINGNLVKVFKEKSKLDEGWINGGFFVFEPNIFKYIENDMTYLEREPLENISKKKQLVAYKHNGFWQCMDTLRDKKILEIKIKEKKHLE